MGSQTIPKQLSDEQSVEEEWCDTFKEHGISEDQAEKLILQIQNHPKLGLGDPTRNEIYQLITAGINTTDFEEYDITNPQQLKNELTLSLKKGLNNKIIGPISLTTPIHKQIKMINKK